MWKVLKNVLRKTHFLALHLADKQRKRNKKNYLNIYKTSIRRFLETPFVACALLII